MGASELPPDEESQRPSAPNPAPASKNPSETSWIKRRLVGTGGRRAPTTHFTLGQAAYVLGFHGIGSFVISGGVNFGIACGEFSSSFCLPCSVFFFFSFLLLNLDSRHYVLDVSIFFSLFHHYGPFFVSLPILSRKVESGSFEFWCFISPGWSDSSQHDVKVQLLLLPG